MSCILLQRLSALAVLTEVLMAVPSPTDAQQVPAIDTEDTSLVSASVGSGRVHPSMAPDVRNSDFARGNYDNDEADLDRLPVISSFALRPNPTETPKTKRTSFWESTVRTCSRPGVGRAYRAACMV
ncbi:hypothetical protein [Sphingomonas sp. CFBP 8765]|jgi:hypothetical protein|uniref:hypothetical protein n=1 Tax=unclassified Sphingomonas TaxID=196159 RepID=UPI0017827E8D|nr:hypothetical protein [Sphingomonas sp. CFBP 8765]MBD8472408.1 hypothetical protein [Sphingomonas sp. CFBP 8765]